MNFCKVKQSELLIFNYFCPQKQQFHMTCATAKVNVDLIFTFVSLILFNCKCALQKILSFYHIKADPLSLQLIQSIAIVFYCKKLSSDINTKFQNIFLLSTC